MKKPIIDGAALSRYQNELDEAWVRINEPEGLAHLRTLVEEIDAAPTDKLRFSILAAIDELAKLRQQSENPS